MILLDSRITAVSRGNIALIFTQGYWYPIQASSLYRPFTTLSYLFNFAVLGNVASPAGYHAVNLASHWLNAALVLSACLAFCSRDQRGFQGSGVVPHGSHARRTGNADDQD
jgi:hypothetical protein